MAQKTAGQAASRTRKASNRLLDGANGEEPGVTHVSLIKATHARAEAAASIFDLNKSMEELSFLLPDSIKEATTYLLPSSRSTKANIRLFPRWRVTFSPSQEQVSPTSDCSQDPGTCVMKLADRLTTIKEAMLTKMWIKAGFLKRATLDCGTG
ncbi:hypothetical protein B0H19DRAFT_1257817 [Mycena capillaripes]|nr:hypothetical protein B0H19DRAFT_1257817 [Mycena capillaripes]